MQMCQKSKNNVMGKERVMNNLEGLYLSYSLVEMIFYPPTYSRIVVGYWKTALLAAGYRK